MKNPRPGSNGFWFSRGGWWFAPCIGVLLAGLLMASAGAAAEDTAGDGASGVQPEMTAFFCGAADYVASLTSFSFDAKATSRHKLGSEAVEEEVRYRFAARRPDLFSLVMELPGETLTLCGDGKRVLIWLKEEGEYTYVDQPEDVGALIGWVTQEPGLRRLLSRDPSAGWMNRLRKGLITTETTSEGTFKVLELGFDRTDAMVRFRGDDTPVPVELKADLSRGANHPPGTLVTHLEWSNWHVEEPIPAELLAIKPPAEAKEVKAFEHGPHAPDFTPGETLLGVQAPPFSLPLLKGGDFALSETRGRAILVLDFWATWCRPCRAALKYLENIAADYAGKGVECLAVDIMEDAATVGAYAESRKMKLPIGLDLKGELARQLHVDAVPTCVIIGREGTIQAYHVGDDRWRERQIRSQLDDILAGKEPVEGTERFTALDRLRYRLGLDPDSFCAVFVGY